MLCLYGRGHEDNQESSVLYGCDHQGSQESSVCVGEIIKVIRSSLFVWERPSRLSEVPCLYSRDHQGNQECSVCMVEVKVIGSPLYGRDKVRSPLFVCEKPAS